MKLEFMKLPFEDKSVLYNIMQLYYYDLSEFESETDKFDINSHGLYDTKYLDHFWTEEGRYPYIAKSDGKISGFVLIRKTDPNVFAYEVSEFFVLRKYRKLKIGSFMTENIFNIHNGHWEIRTLLNNIPAQDFWRKKVADLTEGNYEEKMIRNNTRLAWYFNN
ncbi:MAG: hypothetical protein A2Y24_05910 [Clostridiales bacterium GWE2_32_10]|nr:MAG: hypothetical protein A2Y24_05910 [Clostridiales bacterium GWE2_32_10]